MTGQEHKEYIESLKKYVEWLLEDKERCRQFFISTGIYNEDGTLSKNYGG